jgi:DNA-directed RNA polymerase specialized sigma24 family protein
MTTDREEARDLTQETFARAFQQWDVVSKHERPGAWLQTVVGRLAISWRRRQCDLGSWLRGKRQSSPIPMSPRSLGPFAY